MSTTTPAEQARMNGKRSRGPVSAEGKARSARNATKHGKYAKPSIQAVHTAVLHTEALPDFTDLLERRCQDLRPANSLELDLVRELCDIEWRMDRHKAIEIRTVNLHIRNTPETGRNPAGVRKSLPIDYTCAAYSELLAGSKLLRFSTQEFRQLQKARTEVLRTFLLLRKQPKFFEQSKEPAVFQQLDNWNEPEEIDVAEAEPETQPAPASPEEASESGPAPATPAPAPSAPPQPGPQATPELPAPGITCPSQPQATAALQISPAAVPNPTRNGELERDLGSIRESPRLDEECEWRPAA